MKVLNPLKIFNALRVFQKFKKTLQEYWQYKEENDGLLSKEKQILRLALKSEHFERYLKLNLYNFGQDINSLLRITDTSRQSEHIHKLEKLIEKTKLICQNNSIKFITPYF